ncbi:glutathione-disulfide reductase [Pelistega sp. NLN82]|uniref:Glutathione-disulfide reductase n=1 Tax=Pelistega ratti TaxID=2652177 RepID=A0A6L9Y389_9BURK|nr:glutathione-disulfide reductase [Pelistega ratti]NEN74840.1 glutathione-disulfide reductase [Pelistega ratti]
MKMDFDLLVIGAGSGGVRASRMAAAKGVKVAVVESTFLGGTCVNVGCIPKKLYSYASSFPGAFSSAEGFGWSQVSSTLDWEKLKHNRATEIARLNEVYGNLLKNSGVQLLKGHGALVDANTVKVGDKTYTAKHILIATGGWPVVPDIPGKELAITSNEVFDLPVFPKRLLIIGGGYIASEFASIFNGLGAKVIQVYRSEKILRSFDEDLQDFVMQEMIKHGVDLRVNSDIASLEKTATGILATFKDGRTEEVDQVFFATGRRPNTKGLNLEALGIQTGKRGEILVDEHFRTNIPSIYAVGDVVGHLDLTPVALAEGMVVVDTLFGDGTRQMSYDNIPTAIFTTPNVATVGLSEAQAREKYGDILIFRSDFKALKHTMTGKNERTLMKLIVDKASDKVVGVHMVGDDAGEIIQGFAVALKAGATKAIFDSTIGIHPTAAEEFVTMRTPVEK